MAILTFLTSAVVYLLLLLAGLWCWIHWRHRRLIQVASNVQCVLPTLPIIGNLHYLLLGTDKLTRIMIDEVYKLRRRGSSTFSFWLGPYPVIGIYGVKDIESVLTSTKAMEKGREMGLFEISSQKGILIAPGHIWKKTRPTLDPVFHPRNLSYMMPTFNSNSQEFVAKLAEYESKGPVDVFTHLLPYTVKSVGSLIFGPEFKFSPEDFYKIMSVIERLPVLIMKRIIFFWLHYDGLFRFLYRKDLKTVDTCWTPLAKSLIKVARKDIGNKIVQCNEIRENNKNNYETSEGPENVINAYNKLQNNHPEFTDNDLSGEIFTLFGTGSDTVAVSISTCLLLLAYNQDIQAKLFQEILSVVELKRDITYDDIKRMTYLDQVFKETLRWSCIIPVVLKRASEDIQLSECTIPAGYTIFLGIGGPLMDSSIYPNPTKFDPERFTPENSKQRSRFAYLPFSGGPRNCIGKIYCNLMAKTMIVQVLRRFQLSTTSDVYRMKREVKVFLTIAEGYKISLQPRTL